jgi:hypothetical protein
MQTKPVPRPRNHIFVVALHFANREVVAQGNRNFALHQACNTYHIHRMVTTTLPRQETIYKEAPARASAAQTDPGTVIFRRPPGFQPVGGPPALVQGLDERTQVRNIGGGSGGAEELRRAVGFYFGRPTRKKNLCIQDAKNTFIQEKQITK